MIFSSALLPELWAAWAGPADQDRIRPSSAVRRITRSRQVLAVEARADAVASGEVPEEAVASEAVLAAVDLAADAADRAGSVSEARVDQAGKAGLPEWCSATA